MADLGQPNQTTGLSPATVLVYYNGVLTNATTINPYGTAAFGIGGSIVYVHVYQTVAGLYAYQKWANLSIGYNVPVTTMSTVTSTVSSTSSSTSSTTSISSNNQTGNGGGPGQLYLSESEAISLIGAGGTYGAINVSNPGQQYGVLNGNVTSYWLVGYTIRGFTTTTLISELVYKSPKAQFLYTAQLPQLLGANETVGAVNAISNGLTYSYVTWLGSYSRGSELIGYKNGEFVNIISPYELDQATLASVVAGDIP